MKGKYSLQERILKARTAVYNANNSTALAPFLTAYGYTPEKLLEGQALLTTVLALVSGKEQDYGDQFESTEIFDNKFKECRKTYSRLRKIAKVAFRSNESIMRSLGISSSIKSRLSAFVFQARKFYTESTTKQHITDEMAVYGIHVDELTAAIPPLAELEILDNSQTEETGEAQNSTKARDKAIDELEDWVRDLVDIAKVALETQPQLLEILGRVVKS